MQVKVAGANILVQALGTHAFIRPFFLNSEPGDEALTQASDNKSVAKRCYLAGTQEHTTYHSMFTYE